MFRFSLYMRSAVDAEQPRLPSQKCCNYSYLRFKNEKTVALL